MATEEALRSSAGQVSSKLTTGGGPSPAQGAGSNVPTNNNVRTTSATGAARGDPTEDLLSGLIAENDPPPTQGAGSTVSTNTAVRHRNITGRHILISLIVVVIGLTAWGLRRIGKQSAGMDERVVFSESQIEYGIDCRSVCNQRSDTNTSRSNSIAEAHRCQILLWDLQESFFVSLRKMVACPYTRWCKILGLSEALWRRRNDTPLALSAAGPYTLTVEPLSGLVPFARNTSAPLGHFPENSSFLGWSDPDFKYLKK